MIGSRASLPGLAAIVALGACLGLRSPDPAVADPHLAQSRATRIERAAATAEAAAAPLEAELRAALEAARQGAGRIVAGEEAPGPALRAASDAIDGAVPEAVSAAEALATLDGVLRVLDGAESLPEAASAGELTSIATQLRRTAGPADDFAAMRLRTGELLDALDAAGDALGAGDASGTAEPLAGAERLLDELAAWEANLVTLPIWLETARRMTEAVRRLASAVAAGDAEAAAGAQRDFEAVAGEAREADEALQVAIAEGGAAVADAPLRRLVAALRGVTEARERLASILHPPPSPAP
jgi:hypothetical protein